MQPLKIERYLKFIFIELIDLEDGQSDCYSGSSANSSGLMFGTIIQKTKTQKG